MMLSRVACLIGFIALVSACGTTTEGASTTTTAASSGAGGGPGLMGFTVTFDPITVQPGMENTQCVVRKLPNPSAIHVGTIHNVLSAGSHHMIVYKTNDTVEQPTPFAC